MIRSLFGGITTKCRTVDKLDIFGDGSCKALYRLDGNANDESGNYHGTETAITYGGGVYERGAVFNGSSSVIVNSSLKLPVGAKAISVFVKFSLTSNYPNIINDSDTGYAGSAGVAGTAINVDNGTGKIYIKSKDITVNDVVFVGTSTRTINDNLWHQLVLSWDGSTATNAVKLYIDGSLDSSFTAVHTQLSTPSGYLTIGKAYGVSNFFFNGNIDQLRIFNRAITATEVATLYAECAPTSIVDNINPFEDGSLKALYKFEDNANDSTGVYNGTETNVTYGTGKFGKCAVFNGSSSKINTATGITPVNFSFSAWVNLSSVTLASDIFGTMTSIAYAVGYVIAVNNNLLCILSSSNGTSFTANYNTPFTQLNTWTHISIVVNSDNSIKMYINGNQVTVTPTTTGVITKGATSDRIGTGGASTIHGSIDQLRIFNKALTPMEVASLYNETTPLEEPLYSLVDPFKDGSGKALYRLEGNALDESGNYNGTPTALTYGLGIFGRCGVLNGSSSKIDLTSSLNLTGSLSVSCFIKTTQASGCIISDSPSQFSASIKVYVLSGKVFVSRGTSNISGGAYLVNLTGNVSVNDGTFHNISVVCTTTQITIFVDGVQNATASYSGTPVKATSVKVGVDYDQSSTASNWFNGSIDQLRVFNRALTQQEITTLYTEGA